MACDGKLLRRALDRYEEDKKLREERFAQRRETIFIKEPRLREIDGELRATMSGIIASALRRGTDPRPPLEALRGRNLSLQRERAEILSRLRLPPDCLEEKPNCPLCGDTGYRDGRICRCLREYYAREQKKELSQMLDLGSQSFDTFSLDWYSETPLPGDEFSPRENMAWVEKTCRRYAENFGPGSGSLLLTGAPGLGKTFLSACIAREVSEGGFSVVYDTAAHIFDRFEARKFGRGDGAEGDVARVLRCDLLILDDLGTEMTTALVVSALYEIINSRLMARRATILNTNLPPEELSRRYSPQIASRVEGEFEILLFRGRDIRALKRERQ
ncbi:MAG: ATP-binding protein [Oscillibacter sp.]|jgi:DNA replication protein DnaC|nr:ATP-binding protein [Oscillibacter sp.]